MKDVSSGFAAHIAGEVTTLATCWRLKRRDGQVLGFTDHDSDIAHGELLYKAASGFTPSAIQNTASLSVDNLDVEGVLSSGSITEADILAGKYDFAEIDIFQLNYAAPEQGELSLRTGWLGEVATSNQQFIAEVRGLTQALSHTMGELYSPVCRAQLGDARCGVNLDAHRVEGTVTAADGSAQFMDAARGEQSGLFDNASLFFTNGANAGISMEVKSFQKVAGGGVFYLALPLPQGISEGDAYTVHKGCDKTLAVCHQRFGNVVNFRGEPLVPGLDKMLETAGTRSLG